MNLKQTRERTDEELSEQVRNAREQMFRIRFQKSMGNLEGLSLLRSHKLEVARAKTILRERAIALGAEQGLGVEGVAPRTSAPGAPKRRRKV